jgi:hypothetical protein
MALDFDYEDYDKTFDDSLKFYKIREMVRNHPKKEKIILELSNLKLSTDSNIQLVDRVCEYHIEDLSFKLSLIYMLIVSFIVKLYPLNLSSSRASHDLEYLNKLLDKFKWYYFYVDSEKIRNEYRKLHSILIKEAQADIKLGKSRDELIKQWRYI